MRREEFDVVRVMAAEARAEQERLAARVVNLRASSRSGSPLGSRGLTYTRGLHICTYPPRFTRFGGFPRYFVLRAFFSLLYLESAVALFYKWIGPSVGPGSRPAFWYEGRVFFEVSEICFAYSPPARATPSISSKNSIA